MHGKRGRRAIEAVSEGRVKQYRDFTVVVGYDDEYIVEAGECTCKDAEYNLPDDDPTQRCWHAVAVDVARGLGEVDHHDMWYSEVREFL
jgi:predicted nucleic acid-binding Zn finger protein